MKKFLKILAAAAAVAAVVPYKCKTDENSGLVQGLLYKVTWTKDPDCLSEPDVNVSFGFNNPFEKQMEESELFADELVVDYCCDDTLVTNESRLYREEDYMNEENDEVADEPCCNDEPCTEE